MIPVGSPEELKRLPADRLPDVAAWLRTRIIETVTENGGHLGSNLGAVEMSIALHRVFDSPGVPIVWDTGHQSYAHKLLTGRDEQFDRLRQGGVHAYPLRAESEHDWVENSHASTAVSYAFGMANARRLRGDDRPVVAVVGDGSLTGGLAYEGLNNLGSTDLPVVIVLNDNGRSYAPTVSRLSSSLAGVSRKQPYRRIKRAFGRAAERVPGGRKASLAGWRGIKAVLSGAPALQAFVESLGVAYHGPVDGHDIDAMSEALAYAAARREPVLVHAITIKGLGYAPAEDDDDKKLHDVPPRSPAARAPRTPGPQTFTEAFGEAAIAMAEADDRVVAISAAMVGSTGLAAMQERFPDRVLDVGIAEQHALTTAAGLGLGGARPIVAVYSTFMSRAFDQLNLDAALHDCPLVLAMDRAGITGPDGPSHHGILDIALALRVAGARVLTPSSPELLYNLLTRLDGNHGPIIVRFPKKADFVPTEADGADSAPLAIKLRDGADACIVAYGDRLSAAMDARRILRGQGLDVAVWACQQAKPVPGALLDGLEHHRLVVTVENGVRAGGAGEWLRDELAQMSLGAGVHPHGLPTEFIPPGEASDLLHRYGLDGEGIANRLLAAAGRTWQSQVDADLTHHADG